MLHNILLTLCAPVMWVKYSRGRAALAKKLPAPDVSRARRFTRVDEATENLDSLRRKPKLSANEKIWEKTLLQAITQAAIPHPRPVIRLEGADAMIESFRDYFSAWKMRGLKKNFKKPMRDVKLNYYPDNSPPAYREQEVSLSTAIASEHDDVVYPLPMTDWEDSRNAKVDPHFKALADKYFAEKYGPK